MKPTSVAEIQDIVRQSSACAAAAGGSKTALALHGDGAALIDLSGMRGLIEYEPGEYVFTALAGTPIAEINPILAEHRQFLPFDPPLVQAGATLGGTVAAGLSGPGRYRYGGVRDFILQVKFVDGSGRLVRAGGKVVKNSAGFDLPKLMVGSLGRYGALVELSFKVFPRPAAYVTLQSEYPGLEPALQALIRLSTASLDLFVLDLVPGPAGVSLVVRLGGLPGSFPARIARLQKGGSQALLPDPQVIEGPQESALWQAAGEFEWVPPGWTLVKAPLTPRRIPELEAALAAQGAVRRYSAAGNLAWIAWSGPLEGLDHILKAQGLGGLALRGPAGSPRLGVWGGEALARRVKQALDPQGRWREI
jgi:glycolate oxidase FAD binding subunit